MKNLDVLGRGGATGEEDEGTSTAASGEVGAIIFRGDVPPVRLAFSPANRSSCILETRGDVGWRKRLLTRRCFVG